MQETIARLIDANRNLQMENTILEAFFENSPDLLAIAEDGSYIKLSKSWEDITGWTRAELMSRPFTYFVASGDIPSTMDEDNKLTDEGNGTVDFVNHYRTADGRTVTLQWRSTNIDGTIFAVARVI